MHDVSSLPTRALETVVVRERVLGIHHRGRVLG